MDAVDNDTYAWGVAAAAAAAAAAISHPCTPCETPCSVPWATWEVGTHHSVDRVRGLPACYYMRSVLRGSSPGATASQGVLTVAVNRGVRSRVCTPAPCFRSVGT